MRRIGHRNRNDNHGFGVIAAAVIIAAVVGGTITVWKYTDMKETEYDAKSPLYYGEGVFLASLGENMLLIVAIIAGALVLKGYFSRQQAPPPKTSTRTTSSRKKNNGPKLIGTIMAILMVMSIFMGAAQALSAEEAADTCDTGTAYIVGIDYPHRFYDVFSIVSQELVFSKNITIESLSISVEADGSDADTSTPPSLYVEFGKKSKDVFQYVGDSKENYLHNILYFDGNIDNPYIGSTIAHATIDNSGTVTLNIGNITAGTYILTFRVLERGHDEDDGWKWLIPHTTNTMDDSRVIVDELDSYVEYSWFGLVSERVYFTNRLTYDDDLAIVIKTPAGLGFGGLPDEDENALGTTDYGAVLAVGLMTATVLLFYFRRSRA